MCMKINLYVDSRFKNIAKAYNNNYQQAFDSIINSLVENDNEIDIGDTIKKVSTILEPGDINYKLYDIKGTKTGKFQYNLDNLDYTLKQTLINFIVYMQEKYNCTIGTAQNISLYVPSQGKKLAFYININHVRGNMSIYDYLKNLPNHKVNFNKEKSYKIPFKTIFISEKDQFMRIRGFDKDISNRYYRRILQILGYETENYKYPQTVELSASQISKLIGAL